MFHVNDLWPDGLVWLLLAGTVLSLFFMPRIWPVLLGTTGLVALFLDRISPIALVFTLFGLGIAKISQGQKGLYKRLCHILVVIWGVCLALHQIPGFDNLLVLEKTLTGSDSIPFTMYLNLDKPLIAFGLLLLAPAMLWQKTYANRQQLAIIFGLFLTLPFIAWGVGIVQPEFSLPNWIWVFVINNLIFTCVAEECLFRGYIQRGLCQRFSPTVGITVASLLFGMAHFAGGALFILVATLAGLLYGLTYFWTGKLAFAVLIHFAFNLVHLMFFTYPMSH